MSFLNSLHPKSNLLAIPAILCLACLVILAGYWGQMQAVDSVSAQPASGILVLRMMQPRGTVRALEIELTGGQASPILRHAEVPESGLVRLEVPAGSYELRVQLKDAAGSPVGATQAEVNLVERPIARVNLASVEAPGSERASETPPAIAAAPPPPKPNIILIVADDLDFFDLGCNLASVTRTPRIDQLASQGMRFRNYYASAAKCSPSRAALLTSRSPACFGWTEVIGRYLQSNGSYLQAARGIPAGVPTVAELLKSQGYVTGLVGKWHLGDLRPEFRPTAKGFLEVAEWAGVNIDKVSGDGFYWGFQIREESGPGTVFPRLGQPNSDDHYLTKELTDRAIDFVDRNATGPFFLYLAHLTPHVPLHIPARFDNTPFGYDLSTDDGKTSAMISDLDREIGRLADHVDTLGIGTNTLILVVSDNGGIEPGRAGNGRRHAVMRGWKGEIFEGGTHVPMIARWIGKIPAGTVNATVCSSLDILPTLASLAGAPPPSGVQGRDLSSNLNGRLWGPAPDLCWVAPRFFSYSAAVAAGATYEQLDQFAIRSGNLKLVRGPDQNQPGLYDVRTFIGEFTDLSTTNPDLVASLLARYKSWHSTVSQVPYVLTPAGATLTVPYDARLDFADGDFTFSIDATTTNLTQARVLASRPGCWELTWAIDKVRLKVYDDRPGTLEERAVYLQTPALASGQTHRISFSVYGQSWRSNRILSLYVDGTLAERLLPDAYPPGKSFYAATPSVQPITIGSRPDGTARFLGSLGAPRIFTLALPLDEL